MKNLIQLVLSCMFIGMLALFSSCTEEEINNFSSLNVLDEPKVSAEMAQKLAAGEHYATYEYVGMRIFSKGADETEYTEKHASDWTPGIGYHDKFIINGDEFYVSGGMYTGLRDFIRKGYNESGNENLNFNEDRFLFKKDFNYNIQTSEFYKYRGNFEYIKVIIFSISDEDIVIKRIEPYRDGASLIVFYYYKKTDDHDLSNTRTFSTDTELFDYFVPYLKEIYGDCYEELYRYYKGMPA